MNYEKFVKEVKRGVEDIVEKELGEGVVVVRNVLKNNNVRRKAISIVRKEEVATPTIYLRNYFVDFKHGRDMTNICTEIFNMYLYSMDNFNADIDLRDIADFEKVKTMIHYKLINYEMNKELLKKVPHLKFLDLAIVFNIVIEEDMYNSATALIKKEHLDMWNVSKREIEDVALSNTPKLMPPVIIRMEDMLAEMIINDISMNWDNEEDESADTGQENYIKEDCVYGENSKEKMSEYVREEIEKMKCDDKIDMYVLTNEKRINGAGTIFYDGLLKKFADKIEKDLIIIPSSIHEVILIPSDNGITDEEVNEMIDEVNENELETVEILSNHMYLYRRKEDRIYM